MGVLDLFGFVPKVIGDIAENVAGEAAGAIGGVVNEVTGAFESATQHTTTMPSTTSDEPSSMTTPSPIATTVTASSTEPAVVTVTLTSAKETTSSTITVTASESEEPTSTESDDPEETSSEDKADDSTNLKAHASEKATTATATPTSSDSDIHNSTASDASEKTATSRMISDDSEKIAKAPQKADTKPEEKTSGNFGTSNLTADGDSERTNSEAEDVDSSDAKKTASTADYASQKANSEAEDETSSDVTKSAPTADDSSHKTDSKDEDLTSSDTGTASSAAGETSQQPDSETEESTSSDSDTDTSTPSDESQSTTSEPQDATSRKSETADLTEFDGSQSSLYGSNTRGSGAEVDTSGSRSQNAYADAVAAIDASGREAQGGTVPIVTVDQPIAYQDYSDQNYALLKPRLATSILMALSTSSSFAILPSRTYTIDSYPKSTASIGSYESSIAIDVWKRWQVPTTFSTAKLTSFSSDIVTDAIKHMSCGPGPECDGTLTTSASIDTTPTPTDTIDDTTRTTKYTTSHDSKSSTPSHVPLAAMYDKRGLLVRRYDDTAAPYPTPDSVSDSKPTDVLGTASNSIGGMYTAGTAGNFPTAFRGTDYLFPAATGDVKKRWQESRRRWAEDVDLHSRQATSTTDMANLIATSTTTSSMSYNSISGIAPEVATARVASENLKRTATEPKGHPTISDEKRPLLPSAPRTSSSEFMQPSKNGNGQHTSPVDVPQKRGSDSEAAGQKGTKPNSSKNQNRGKQPFSKTKLFSEHFKILHGISPDEVHSANEIIRHMPDKLRARRAKAASEASGIVSKSGKQGQQLALKGTSASKKSQAKQSFAKHTQTGTSDWKITSNFQGSRAGTGGHASSGTGRQSTSRSSAPPGGQEPNSRDQPGSSSQHGTTDRSGRVPPRRSLSGRLDRRSGIEPRSEVQRTVANEPESSEAKERETSKVDRLTVSSALTSRSPGGSQSKPENNESRRKHCRLRKKTKERKGKGKHINKPVPDEGADCDLEALRTVKHANPDDDLLHDLPSSMRATPPMSRQEQTKDSQHQQNELETFDPEDPSAPPKRPPTPKYPPKNAKPGDFGLDKWSDLTPEEGRRLMIKEQLAEMYPDDSMESFHPPKVSSSLAPPKPGTNPWTGGRLSQAGQDTYTPPGSMSSSISSDVSESKYVPSRQEENTRKLGSKPPKRRKLLRRADRRTSLEYSDRWKS